MLPRSKGTLAFLVAVPLLLIIPLWQAANKRPRLWGVLSAPSTSLALSNNGSVVSFSKGDGTLGVWPYAGTQQEKRIGATGISSPYSPPELRFSDDDKTLLASNIRIGDVSTALYAWDVTAKDVKWSALSDADYDYCRYWVSTDGKRAVQRANNVVTVLDITGEGARQTSKKSKIARSFPVVARFKAVASEPNGKTSRFQTMAISPDGKTIVGATRNGQLEFWDTQKGTRLLQTKATSATETTDWKLQYSPDGRFVALFDGAIISVWDMGAGKWTTTTVLNSTSEAALAWMPDSSSLWTGSGTVQQWSVPKLERLRDLPVGGPVAVSGDGQVLVTRAAANNGMPSGIWVWDIG